jgi:hypothetical protein
VTEYGLEALLFDAMVKSHSVGGQELVDFTRSQLAGVSDLDLRDIFRDAIREISPRYGMEHFPVYPNQEPNLRSAFDVIDRKVRADLHRAKFKAV